VITESRPQVEVGESMSGNPLRAVYKGSGSTNEAQNFVLPE